MKRLIATLIICGSFGFAQQATEENKQEPKSESPEIKRLSSVTWDLNTHKLVWTVEKGTIVDGEFVPATKVKYEVSPEQAFMAYAGEKRALGEDEASSLHELLNVLSLYCVESVVWWEQGAAGAELPVDNTAPGLVTKPAPSKSPAKPESKPVKVGDDRYIAEHMW